MGTLTGVELEAELKANLGNRSDLDTRLYIFLNWAQVEIARKIYLRELEDIDTAKATVVDQDYVAKPINLRDMISFRLIDDTNSRKLRWVPRRMYDEWCANPSSLTTARSTHFTSWGLNFYFYRIPDAVYSLKMAYTKWPTAFIDSSSEVSDIEELDELIVILATIKALRSLKEVDPRVLSAYKKDARLIIADAKAYDKGLMVDEEVKAMYNLDKVSGNYWTDPFVRTSP